MVEKEIRVLHIDTELTWRGGQQQVFYLHKGLVETKIFSLLICNPNSEIQKRSQEIKLPVNLVRMFGEIDILAAFKISRICKKEKINIIQAHSAHALSIGLIAKYFYRKVKLVGVRRVDFHIKKNPLSGFKYKSNLVDKIVCVSDAVGNILKLDGLKEQKLCTIHDGIDVNKFKNIQPSLKLKESLKISPNNIVIGTIAAFVGHKDYPNLISAAKIVIGKFKDVTFIALGDGQLKQEMELLVDKLKIKKEFIFAGFQKDIGEYLKIFDIFVLSSKLEGLGTSILDAQSVGLPVIATRTGGIPEVLNDHVDGILVEKGNSEKLSAAIVSLIQDQEKRKNLGYEAMRSVKKFSIENNVDKNIDLYKELLSK